MASDRARLALELRRSGMTFRQIGKELQVSPARARKLVEGTIMDDLRANGFVRSVAYNMAKILSK